VRRFADVVISMSRRPPSPAPIRAMLEAAHAETPAFGHPDEGFLSELSGFLFQQAPLLSMSTSHIAWDEIAAVLPAALETGRVRGLVDALPLLPADTESLDASYLCRAATILGVVAHAYAVEINAGRRVYLPHTAQHPTLPDCVELPWKQVCQRLGRRQPALTYYDLIMHNWRMRDPAAEHPRDVENLEVLVPALGNQEERIFYMTMVETHARSAALIGAVARIEEAIPRRDFAVLKAELQLVQRTLDHITFQSLLKIDPNPYSSTHVDPLVWAKTVGPFAASTRDGELGLSGAGGPVFHLLDALFERQRYDSQIGDEARALFGWMPARHAAFIEATGRIGLAGFVEQAGDQDLAGLYHGAVEAYAGKRGWLGMHRLKVYGFMELGFRGGRTQTNGGFHGTVEKLAWEGLDDTLEESRQERHSEGPPIGCPFARRHSVQAASDGKAASVKQVTLDVGGQGFVYEPGDRIGLLTQNSDELVSKTLAALQASGEELVPLNSVWREAMRQYPDAQLTEPARISLTTFLARARIRPLLRPIGKALHALTRSPRLKAILEAREEDQWELWDTLQLLASENYDTRRLWKSEIWQAESIARLVPPQQFRVYSISSAHEAATAASLDLTVGPLTYEGELSSRHGTASHFLTRHAPQAPAMPAQLVRPSRFRLPVDRQRPIVMFGAGTGFAPFRGFLQARSQQAGCGGAHLFLGTTSPDRLPYREELERWIAAGQLNLRSAFSRAQISIDF
jgi:sulfite reductase (NADPH) flavoprotein alpha-component